jgi:hypothetical protein
LASYFLIGMGRIFMRKSINSIQGLNSSDIKNQKDYQHQGIECRNGQSTG